MRVIAEIAAIVGPDIEIVTRRRDVGLENEFGGPLVEAMAGMLGRHDPGAPVLPYLLGAAWAFARNSAN